MNTEEQVLYSKRYPSVQQEMGQLIEGPLPSDWKSSEESLQEFWRHMEETVYHPIPGRQEQGQKFIATAKELSEAYGIDLDIRQKEYFIEVNLHLYCASYSDELTKMFAQLFNMCDRFSSFILTTEPSDFTLSLDFFTHEVQ